MSSEAPAKMLANQQMQLVRPSGSTHSFMTLNASMAVADYARCDLLIPEETSNAKIHYKVNLSQTIVELT